MSPLNPFAQSGPFARLHGLLWRRFGHLEALAGFHVPHPVLQFPVLGHWLAAVRHAAEILEQRDDIRSARLTKSAARNRLSPISLSISDRQRHAR